MASDPAAAAIRDSVLANTAFWVDLPDHEILRLIPPASVPRSYSVATAGCPKCGLRVYEKGTYPWILKPEEDIYRITCPIDATTYPGNRFTESLASEFKDRDRPGISHYDDGWGWKDADGNRYWFVAYACGFHWQSRVLPGVRDLARAYLLTGDARYAHPAAVMLAEIADRYPSMSYRTQSQRGVEFKDPYAWGRILDYVSETRTLSWLAEAYDCIWPWIDQDTTLQRLRGQTGEQIRALIEANILEEGMDAVWEKDILGNYGMHQMAYAKAAICRQNGPVHEWLRQLLDPDKVPHNLHEGFKYALFNAVFRDGFPTEVSPAYNTIWPRDVLPVIKLLREAGLPCEELDGKLVEMVASPLRITVAGQFTPDQGDSGSPYGGVIGPGATESLIALSIAPHALLEDWVNRRSYRAQYHDFESLLRPPVSVPERKSAAPAALLLRGRLLDGYGMGILESPSRTWGIALYYGHIDGHSHRDPLNFDLYALGQKMMPDLGYPDQTDGFTPGRMSWTNNTIAHNTVMIDRAQPRGFGPAEVRRFVSTDELQALEVEGASLFYPQAQNYRRILLMVETGADAGYVVDVFRVVGGDEHHYSLHGPPGEVRESDGLWSQPMPGTLAGPHVPLRQLYDRPVMMQPDYKGTFYDYYGSGFSHFVNCRTLQDGTPILQYHHLKDPAARLQIILLAEHGDEVISADAQASPLRYKELIRYLLVHRMRKTDDPLESTFAAVVEPFTQTPSVRGAVRHMIDAGIIVEVDRRPERDVLFVRLGGEGGMEWSGIRTDADLMQLTFDATGGVNHVVFCGGTSVEINADSFAAATPGALRQHGFSGRVVSVLPDQRKAVIQSDSPTQSGHLIGRFLAFRHEGRTNRHHVIAAREVPGGIEVTLEDDLRIGRGRVLRLEPGRVITKMKIGMVPGIFPGSRLADAAFSVFEPVVSVSPAKGREGQFIEEGIIQLASATVPKFLRPDHDFWLCSFGPGAEVRAEAVSSWHRPNRSR